MSPFNEFFIRAIPVIGTMVVSAFAISYTWNYVNQKQRYHMGRFDANDGRALQFYKDVSSKSTNWKSKRVSREWEVHSKNEE